MTRVPLSHPDRHGWIRRRPARPIPRAVPISAGCPCPVDQSELGEIECGVLLVSTTRRTRWSMLTDQSRPRRSGPHLVRTSGARSARPPGREWLLTNLDPAVPVSFHVRANPGAWDRPSHDDKGPVPSLDLTAFSRNHALDPGRSGCEHPACGWWAGEDSNLRRRCRQIYSLLPLATRAPTLGPNTLAPRPGRPPHDKHDGDRDGRTVSFRPCRTRTSRARTPTTP